MKTVLKRLSSRCEGRREIRRNRERETIWRRVQNNFIYYTRRRLFEKGGE